MQSLKIFLVVSVGYGLFGCATANSVTNRSNNGEVVMKEVSFDSQGERVVGDLYLPAGSGPFPGVVVAGSWTTVKEQMAGLYAKRLAENGFAALAIDARGFGASEGEPRYFESPERKITDYKNAVTFLQQNESVDGKRIGALGICAGAGYIARVASEDSRISAIGFVAAWLHDGEAVKMVYGGEQGVANKIQAAQVAKEKYRTTGEVAYVPNISETDESAAMHGPFVYYLDKQRGAIPEWGKKFAVMSWEDWLTFNPLPSAPGITQPVLMIHSDDAVLPDYAKRFYKDLASSQKNLHWTKGGQFDFYDQDAQVDESIAELAKHFAKYL